MPAAETLVVAVAEKPAPKLYAVPPVAVSIEVVFVQFKLLAEAKPAVGEVVFCVSETLAVAVQPFAPCTVTV